MKLLTAKEKVEILIKAKERIASGDSYYMCCAISAITEREIVSSEVEQYIPELFKYKPMPDKCIVSIWFPTGDKKHRIEILDKTIEDIKNK